MFALRAEKVKHYKSLNFEKAINVLRECGLRSRKRGSALNNREGVCQDIREQGV